MGLGRWGLGCRAPTLTARSPATECTSTPPNLLRRSGENFQIRPRTLQGEGRGREEQKKKKEEGGTGGGEGRGSLKQSIYTKEGGWNEMERRVV